MKKILKKTVATLLVLSAIFTLVACKSGNVFRPKLNLEDCVSVEFSGFNGFGKAELKIDEAAIDTQVDAEKFTEYINQYLPSSLLKGITLSKTIEIDLKGYYYNLSNGDKVTVAISLPETLTAQGVTFETMSEAIDLTVEAVEMEFTVSGLEEAEVFDVSSFIEENIQYEGANGAIKPKVIFDENFTCQRDDLYLKADTSWKNRLELIYENKVIAHLTYGCTNEKLSKKDKFNISVEINGYSYSKEQTLTLLAEKNFVIPKMSFEFTVPDDVNDYITKKEQLTKDVVEQLDKLLWEELNKKTYYVDVAIVESYIATIKPDGISYRDSNSYVLSIVKRTETGYFSRGTVYMVAPAYNVMITSEGKIEAVYNDYDMDTYATLEEAYKSFDSKNFNYEKYN